MPVAIATVYVVLYVAVDWVSYIHPIVPFAITAWNPPPGVSLALLMLYGLRFAPWLFVAALLADLIVHGGHGSIGLSVLFAAILALGYTSVGHVLVHWLRLGTEIRRLGELTMLIIGVALSVLAVALVYVGAHAAFGLFEWSLVPEYGLRFWVGDTLGILVTTPFLLALGRSIQGRSAPRVAWDTILPAVALALALWVVFGIDVSDKTKFFYVLFLPLIWVAMSHGLPGAATGLVAIQIGLIVVIVSAHISAEGMLEFQLLMLALTITGLYLGVAATERRLSEEALRERERSVAQTLRVAAAAETASALAHELNQPLSAASNYARAVKLLLGGPREEIERVTDRAIGEIQRAAEVVRRLREFYRSGSMRPEPTRLAQFVDEALEPLHSRLERSGVDVALDLAADLPEIEVDRVQMTIVLHNLVTNAIDAIVATDARTRRVTIRARADGAHQMRITVEDSGPGVSAEIAARLFQPFASGKRDGLGLGLSISRSIVENHGGRLQLVQSASGACFEISIPIVQ